MTVNVILSYPTRVGCSTVRVPYRYSACTVISPIGLPCNKGLERRVWKSGRDENVGGERGMLTWRRKLSYPKVARHITGRDMCAGQSTVRCEDPRSITGLDASHSRRASPIHQRESSFPGSLFVIPSFSHRLVVVACATVNATVAARAD